MSSARAQVEALKRELFLLEQEQESYKAKCTLAPTPPKDQKQQDHSRPPHLTSEGVRAIFTEFPPSASGLSPTQYESTCQKEPKNPIPKHSAQLNPELQPTQPVTTTPQAPPHPQTHPLRPQNVTQRHSRPNNVVSTPGPSPGDRSGTTNSRGEHTSAPTQQPEVDSHKKKEPPKSYEEKIWDNFLAKLPQHNLTVEELRIYTYEDINELLRDFRYTVIERNKIKNMLLKKNILRDNGNSKPSTPETMEGHYVHNVLVKEDLPQNNPQPHTISLALESKNIPVTSSSSSCPSSHHAQRASAATTHTSTPILANGSNNNFTTHDTHTVPDDTNKYRTYSLDVSNHQGKGKHIVESNSEEESGVAVASPRTRHMHAIEQRALEKQQELETDLTHATVQVTDLEKQLDELLQANQQLREVVGGENIPEEYVCPITREIMADPVVTMDGHTYERSAITIWFQKKAQATSPLTNETLPNKSIIPNHTLRKQIDTWKENVRNLQSALKPTASVSAAAQKLEKQSSSSAKTKYNNNNSNSNDNLNPHNTVHNNYGDTTDNESATASINTVISSEQHRPRHQYSTDNEVSSDFSDGSSDATDDDASSSVTFSLGSSDEEETDGTEEEEEYEESASSSSSSSSGSDTDTHSVLSL